MSYVARIDNYYYIRNVLRVYETWDTIEIYYNMVTLVEKEEAWIHLKQITKIGYVILFLTKSRKEQVNYRFITIAKLSLNCKIKLYYC